MDSPQRIIPIKEEQPQLPSPCGSRKRRLGGSCSPTGSANSPEFEFWMLRNPSFPQPNLLSADELFVDGVLLPLHHLHLNNTTTTSSNPDDPPDEEAPEPSNSPPEPEPEMGPQISAQPTASTASKRWKDIFGKKTAAASSASTSKDKNKDKDRERDRDKEKEKKREKKSSNAAAAATPHGPTAELNINIWPFSRSRSAGNSASRPKMAPAAPRKVSSAPCSRSNSAGESKSRKWPSSPGRPGVHLGRSSPVWQVRRGATKATTPTSSNIAINHHHSEAVVRSGEKGAGRKDVTTETTRHGKNTTAAGGGKAKGLNLNVPTCIGYRNHLSCRSHENSAVAVGRSATNGGKLGGGGGNITANGGNGASLFNLRSLFTKKVY